MAVSDLNSYQMKERYFDAASFLSASLTFCALKGGPMFDQFGVGCLLATAANSLSITVVSKILNINAKTTYVVKICAVISALTFSSLALPYVVMSVAAKTTIFLNYEVSIVFAIAHLVTKISFYILYRISCAIKNRYFQPLPIKKVETKLQFLRSIIKKFHELPYPSIENINWRKVGLVAFGILFSTAVPLALYFWGSNAAADVLPNQLNETQCLKNDSFLLTDARLFSPIKQPSIATILPNILGEKEALNCSANSLTLFNQTQPFQNIFGRKEVVESLPTKIKNITPIATKNITRLFFPMVTLISATAGLILYGSRVRRELLSTDDEFANNF